MNTIGVKVQAAEGVPAELYAPPSREQLFWMRHLDWLLAPTEGKPSLLARAWGVVAVAPFAHITFFSLFYQAYLYDVFHQTRTARFWHQLCMPLTNLMIMAALAPAQVGGISGGALYALLLLGWYLAQAAAGRLYLWGLLMIPLVGALYVGAALYHRATADSGVLASPFLWMALFSFAQAVSHASEPKLPPRVTASARWKTIREFLRDEPPGPGRFRGRPIRILRLLAQTVWGTLAELWASPRLFPYGVLAQMRRRGYATERLDPLDQMTRRAIASGDPAVDFIGTGGGAFLSAPGAPPRPGGLVSRAWRLVFLVEIPLTLGACAYWAIAPSAHLEGMFGAGAANPATLALQAQLTAVVFSLVVWFYGRWLLSGDIALRPFRYLQEGFAIGDVILILVALHGLSKQLGTPALWVAQAVMAGLWLAVRVLFLARTRRQG